MGERGERIEGAAGMQTRARAATRCGKHGCAKKNAGRWGRVAVVHDTTARVSWTSCFG